MLGRLQLQVLPLPAGSHARRGDPRIPWLLRRRRQDPLDPWSPRPLEALASTRAAGGSMAAGWPEVEAVGPRAGVDLVAWELGTGR